MKKRDNLSIGRVYQYIELTLDNTEGAIKRDNPEKLTT